MKRCRHLGSRETPGRFLICAGQDKNTVGVYEIALANGVLTPLHRYSVGLNPSWVETLALPARL
jgi:6-phosphogluconolactonase